MSVETLASQYISSAEHVFDEIGFTPSLCLQQEKIKEVLEAARFYLRDAKYYFFKKNLR